MRSTLKFFLYVIIAVIIPAAVMSIVLIFDQNYILMLIAQLFVIMLMILAFTSIFKLTNKYEKKTEALIKDSKNIKQLQKLRDERKTYQSKANITRAILLKEYSDEEAEKLKKYTNKTSDMAHFYAGKISNLPADKKEEYKIRRDNFNKKYGKKARVYPDFKGNLRFAIKWTLLFFLASFIFVSLKKYINPSLEEAIFIYTIQMILLIGLMANALIWIIRALISKWNQDFL